MSSHGHWGGDPLPGGLTPDDRIGWEIASTIVVRFVPDPETGRKRGLSIEYHGALPKVLLAQQLMLLVQDLMTHDDFQDGVEARSVRDESDDEEGPGDG